MSKEEEKKIMWTTRTWYFAYRACIWLGYTMNQDRLEIFMWSV